MPLRARLPTIAARRVVSAAAFIGVMVIGHPADAAPSRAPKATRAHGKMAKKVTIDVVDADIRNVLRLISDVGGMNFVIDDDVQGTVSVKLQNVAVDQALRAILRSKGLGAERDGNLYRIAPASRLAAETSAQLDAYSACLKNAPLRIRVIPVANGAAPAMVDVVKSTLTPRGTVSVDVRTNHLIVRDVSCRRPRN